MKTSSQGYTVIKYFESCILKAYPDPGSKDGKPWTIGWGHTGPDVVPGVVWTQVQSDDALARDLVPFEAAVSRLVKVALQQCQFDALVAFSYNVGIGALEKSTLLRLMNAGDVVGAANQFLKWINNDGKPMRGLIRRRNAERMLFLGLDAEGAIQRGLKAA